jgi:hypothetical protein
MDDREDAAVEGIVVPALPSAGDLAGRVTAVGDEGIVSERPVGPDVTVPLDATRDDPGDALIQKAPAEQVDWLVPPTPPGEGTELAP